MTYDEFLSERLGDLLRFAVVLCGDRGLGEDLVHDVLLRAQARWDRIGRVEYPFAYVRTMVVNEHLTWRRKWSRQIPTETLELSASSPDHADQIANRDDVMARLRALPARQRAAVVLRYYGDLPDQEIADTLGCSAGTVRGYISRALATMRVQLSTETRLAWKDA